LQTLGGWPVLDANWNASAFDLEVLLAKLRLYNNRVLINVWVGADDKNSDVNIIMVSHMMVYAFNVTWRMLP
jgi:Peptidase family M13